MTSALSTTDLTPPRPVHSFSMLRENCLCPITHEVMQDPVVAADGHTYERSAIQSVFRLAREQRQPAISPIMRQPLANSTLTVNAAMRSSIGQLPECDLVAAGAHQRDAFTDAPPAPALAPPSGHGPRLFPERAATAPLPREDALGRLGPEAGERPASPPLQQAMVRRAPSPGAPMRHLQTRIAAARADLEPILSRTVAPPADGRRQEAVKERQMAAAMAVLTCGSSYLCGKVQEARSEAAGVAYCMSGCLIGYVTSPVVLGIILVDTCCCGVISGSLAGCLGCFGFGGEPEPTADEAVNAYVTERLKDWNEDAWCLYNCVRDRHHVVWWRYSLRHEAIAHAQAYIATLTEFHAWCERKGVPASDRACILRHIANVRRGEAYEGLSITAHPRSPA